MPVDQMLDEAMRLAAFEHLRSLCAGRDFLTSQEISEGFLFEGKRIPLVNPQRGIFKPRQMKFLLSIRTVFPRRGARIWYDDQRRVNQQVFDSEDFVEYAFMGKDPNANDNQWLREAYEQRTPIIYFIGVSPGQYVAVVPSYLASWNPKALTVSVGFGNPGDYVEGKYPDNVPARRYALRLIKQRLHQASFRDAVITAYQGRCAISGLPEPLLLDAAHIINDRDEVLGHPIVPNGLPLSKIHHAAFDAHLIGIDQDMRIYVSEKLLNMKDGPMLDAIKSVDRSFLRLPSRHVDQPDPDRLARRYEEFKSRC